MSSTTKGTTNVRYTWIIILGLPSQSSVEERVEQIGALPVCFGQLLIVDVSATERKTRVAVIRLSMIAFDRLLKIEVNDIIVEVLPFVEAVQVITRQIESNCILIQSNRLGSSKPQRQELSAACAN